MRTTRDTPPLRHWPKVAAELRDDPGEWRRVIGFNPRSARAYGSHIRNGGLAAFNPPGAFEAEVRGDELWARYVGPHQERSGDPATP